VGEGDGSGVGVSVAVGGTEGLTDAVTSAVAVEVGALEVGTADGEGVGPAWIAQPKATNKTIPIEVAFAPRRFTFDSE
jgi:hypothetical protein